MAATTTMHFGPEWMRTKQQQSSRTQPPPSPPPVVNVSSGASTYSALVSPASAQPPEKRDEAHPFRYSKEDLLRIYKGGSRGGLGLEVERWEGVVREIGSEPIALREMTEVEKKLFAGPLNSDLRRRQSSDLLSSLSTTSHGSERHRSNHNSPGAGSPLRERFGSLIRRKDSTDQPLSIAPRKLSTSGPPPLLSPRDIGQPSPRPRVGFASNFDGVLNGGESWAARRRTSEGYLKGANARGEAAVRDAQCDSKGSEVKEEDEREKQEELNESSGTGSSGGLPFSHSISSQSQLKEEFEAQLVSVVPNDSSSTSDTRSNSSNGMDIIGGQRDPNSAPHTSTMDPASVEWSYLDPQGQVQGPFRADLMQKWYDEGYFIPELLMKRTNIDTDWMAVAELSRRAGGNKVFLSLQMAETPPGLSRPPPSPVVPGEQNIEPHQPMPVRSLLPGTLEAYLTSGATPSESQPSPGGGVVGNGSPDDGSSGIPAHHSYPMTDASMGRRVAGFPPLSDPIALATTRRNTHHDPSLDPSIPIRPSYSHIAPGRSSTTDTYSFNVAYNSSPSPNWPSLNLPGPPFDGATQPRSVTDIGSFPSSFSSPASSGRSLVQQSGYAGSRGSQEVLFVEMNTGTPSNSEYLMGDHGHQKDIPYLSKPPEDSDLPTNLDINDFANRPLTSSGTSQPYPVSVPSQYPAPSPQQQSPGQLSTRYMPPLDAIVPAPQSTVNRSPWITQDSTAVRRPDPFGPPHPTTANTVPIRPPTPPQANWGLPRRKSMHSSLPSEQSPWFIASQDDALDEGWKDNTNLEGLASQNIGRHDQLQQKFGTSVESQVNNQKPADHLQQPPIPEPAPPPVGATSQATVPGSAKSRRKSVAQQQPLVSKPSLALVPISKGPSSPPLPSAPIKMAWLNEDDTKMAKSANVSVSLRDIQEAESKRNDARKAAERERERQSRGIVAPAPVESLQSFTTTWGLPTSQAGGARNTTSQGVTSSASAPSTSAVWTNTSKTATAKKSMKEIQEEEEQRKKIPVKETVAAAAARRGYSETIKPTPPSSIAWTTVGAGGKIPGAVTAAGRQPPSSASTTSAASNSTRTNGVSTCRPSAAAVGTKPGPTPSKPEEPATPSHDFLKWLSESLKGLNNSVNVEEIISMLLSFPMDPDSSTMEIISDLIYINSTTLDGRRFASEFVNKRKADAASRQQGSGGLGSTKPVSIADVVKAQPKPSQPEWGGFKVVNKKKKGGRS